MAAASLPTAAIEYLTGHSVSMKQSLMPGAAPGMMKMGLTGALGACLMALAAVGQRPCYLGASEPVKQSGLDVDTHPELLPPAVGEHAEQIVQLLDVPGGGPFGGAPWTRCF
jgi:hypothetical protein